MRPLLLSLLFAAPLAQAQQWSQLTDLPAAARDNAAAFCIGSEVFVGSGMDNGFQFTSDWYRYRTWDDTWSPISPLPAAARQYSVAFSLDGLGYLQGGLTSTGATAQLWMYDPSLNAWFARSPLPSAPRSASACFTLNGLAYVIGGILQNGTASAQVFAYDAPSNTWVARAALPGPPRHRAMAFSANGKGYVFGGADAQFNALREGWRYDPVTDSWSPADSLPEARYAGNAVDLLDGGLLIGGASDATTVHDDVWRYSVWDDSWTVLPTFPGGPRRGACGVAWGGTKAYFGTGSDDAVRFADWFVLDVPVGLVERTAEDDLRLWPVPVNDLLHVDGPGTMHGARLELYDATGRRVLEGRAGPGTTIATTTLGPGWYRLVVHEAERVRSASFIKEP